MGRRQRASGATGDVGATLNSRLRTQHGTSLVELLTSVFFVGVLSLIASGFARAALMSARVLEAKSETQEGTVMALDVLARDVRAAGFSAAGHTLLGVTDAAPTRVEVAADLNGNGTTADANEVIAYSYDSVTHTLMRATGGSNPQPLASNVPLDGVRFTFFDATGAEISASAVPMSAEERRRIRRIDVTLRIELPNPDPNGFRPLATTMSTSIALRNP